MSTQSFWYQVYTTFVASIRSVGTAVTMASVGIYLHSRGFIFGDGKKTLALISQQVTIPLFLFSKIIYCNQDWSDEPCPDVTDKLQDIWVLLLWPFVVVSWGLLVGYIAARVSKTENAKACMAACAFGNSTGLPITLLTVVHSNFPETTELGAVDPTLFLSVYLLLYPVLQWGVGGWLLAPEETEDPGDDEEHLSNRADSFRNVLNNDAMQDRYCLKRRGLSETDASLYISQVDLVRFAAEEAQSPPTSPPRIPPTTEEECTEETTLLQNGNTDGTKSFHHHFHSFRETLDQIVKRCLQPPVIGAMLGLFVAATPLRGIFVDLIDRGSHAPLQWFFDGLYKVGQAAVPLNMMILGCNLSASHLSHSGGGDKFLSQQTMVAIVIGKMIVMPIIGITSAILLNAYVWDIPESINASFYLVAMIVFITPTANNVMVMVELSGSGAKEGIAQVIAWQYAVSPIILSLTMTVAVGVASQWS